MVSVSARKASADSAEPGSLLLPGNEAPQAPQTAELSSGDFLSPFYACGTSRTHEDDPEGESVCWQLLAVLARKMLAEGWDI